MKKNHKHNKDTNTHSDNYNMYDCASCDTASECHYRTEPYDSDVRQAADEEDYIDSVEYPLDQYIYPRLLKTRKLENEYDYMVRQIADASRTTNETIVNMLSHVHKMEMATLLEYLTQQSAVTNQIIIDTIDTVLSDITTI